MAAPTSRPQCTLVVPDDLTPPLRMRPSLQQRFDAASVLQSNRSGHEKYPKSARAFAPAERDGPNGDVGWADALRASQHPSECKRFLLLEDDWFGSGLGMDTLWYSVALLLAVAQRRVLLRVPGRGPRPYLRWADNATISGRYCDRPPWTLDCMWEPLSHCEPSLDSSTVETTPGWQQSGLTQASALFPIPIPIPSLDPNPTQV